MSLLHKTIISDKIHGITGINEIRGEFGYAKSGIGRNTNGQWIPYIYTFKMKNVSVIPGDEFGRVQIKGIKSLNAKECLEYLESIKVSDED